MKKETKENKTKMVSVRLSEDDLAKIKTAMGEPKAGTAIMIAARKGAGIKVKVVKQ